MYRPGTNDFFPLAFFLPLFFLASCGNAQVLGIPKEEAAELLRKGNTNFIGTAVSHTCIDSAGFTKAVSKLKPLTRIHPAAPYYAGLQAESQIKIMLFCSALKSPSLPARREAMSKLIPMILEAEHEAWNVLAFLDTAKPKENTTPLRAACLYKLGRYSEAGKLLAGNKKLSAGQEGEDFRAWEKALALFTEMKGSIGTIPESMKQRIIDFLFEVRQQEILTWAYGEANSIDKLLSPAETAALLIKINPRDYMAALFRLPEALSDGGVIFFRYPELITLLGRAFQYTPIMREEGAQLFRSWDRLLKGENDPAGESELTVFINTLDPESLNACKFGILFYLGRIERARGMRDESSEFFRSAQVFAPNDIQWDSCIWYILMNAIEKDPLQAVSLTLDAIPQWKDASYFDDVLDRLSCYLTGRRQWGLLLELFHALEKQNAEAASLAQYAWILGRAEEEGFIANESQRAVAESFFRIAFESVKGSFYHKVMAASKLGETFIPENNRENLTGKRKIKKITGAEKDEIEFIQGFLEYGAGSFTLPYIQSREEDLSITVLEKAAEALAVSSRWKDSLDLVSRYSGRKNHSLSRQDLLMFYPRPYKELVEKYAKEAELGPELLYGLIRTESYFMSGVVSRSGAVGLTQLMPATAEEMTGRIIRRGGPNYRVNGGVDLKNPEANIHIGSFYLRYLTEQMGSIMPALLAYNGGMGRIRRALAADARQGDGGLPRGSLPMDLFLETIDIHETREYGRRVLASAAVYGYLYYGMSMEAALADINER